MEVIMFMPSFATVLTPVAPAPMKVCGARTIFWGTWRTNHPALLAKEVNAPGVFLKALAPARKAPLVILKAVAGTWPAVVRALFPNVTKRPGAFLMVLKAEFAKVGTPFTNVTALDGAFLMELTPKFATLSTVLGTALIVPTVKSLTASTVWGTMLTPSTTVSETVSTAVGTALTTFVPVWMAVLPVFRTRLKGVRRTSWVICCGDLTTLDGPRTGTPDTRDANNTNRTAS
jgi:hypothetical protein